MIIQQGGDPQHTSKYTTSKEKNQCCYGPVQTKLEYITKSDFIWEFIEVAVSAVVL